MLPCRVLDRFPFRTPPPANHPISAPPSQPVPINFFRANPLESALPQIAQTHFVTSIESTPIFTILPFLANFAPVTPAYTSLTKPPSANPNRMNTSEKTLGVLPHEAVKQLIINDLSRNACHAARPLSPTSLLPYRSNHFRIYLLRNCAWTENKWWARQDLNLGPTDYESARKQRFSFTF
jgi:hypothetical protein